MIDLSMLRRLFAVALAMSALALAACAPWVAQAQDAWPTKPIKIIVPFAAGGTSDVLARIVADKGGRYVRGDLAG